MEKRNKPQQSQNNATVGATIKAARSTLRVTLRELGEAIGTDHANLYKKESGVIGWKIDELVKAADFLQIPRGTVLTQTQLDKWERSRSSVATIQRSERGIPVINRAPGGKVMDYDHASYSDEAAAFEYLPRTADLMQIENLFAVVVVGDSMEPALVEGDYAIFRPVFEGQESLLEPGKAVFVRFTQDGPQRGGCAIYRLGMGDDPTKITLAKDNPRYKPITVGLNVETIERIAICVRRQTRLV